MKTSDRGKSDPETLCCGEVGSQSRGRQIRLDGHQRLRDALRRPIDSVIHPALALSTLFDHCVGIILLSSTQLITWSSLAPSLRPDEPNSPPSLRLSDGLNRKKSRSNCPRTLSHNLLYVISGSYLSQCRHIYIPSPGQRAPSSSGPSSRRSWWSACHTSSLAQPHDAPSPIQG